MRAAALALLLAALAGPVAAQDIAVNFGDDATLATRSIQLIAPSNDGSVRTLANNLLDAEMAQSDLHNLWKRTKLGVKQPRILRGK
jgi:hypothetical protein